VVGEVEEGCGCEELLSLEEKRRLGEEEEQYRCREYVGATDAVVQAVAEGTIADLVVVLNAVDELMPGLFAGHRPAMLAGGGIELAFKEESLGDDPGEFSWSAFEAAKVAFTFRLQDVADDVVEVVRPDAIHASATVLEGAKIDDVVLVGFRNEVPGPAVCGCGVEC
jgi:hypothetical protein